MDNSWDDSGDHRGKRIEQALSSLNSNTRPRAWQLAFALLLSLPTPLLLASKRDLIVNYTLHDLFIPVDAAWRTLQGQWPHTDFYSPLGLTYFAQHGAAAWLWGLDSHVVSRADFVALPFVLLPALMFATRRLNAFSSILLTLFLTVVITSPFPLDGPERYIAYLADYNGLGGALCAVIALWALAAPGRRWPAWDVADAVVVGGLLMLLLFLKITMFVLAIVIVLAGCVVTRRLWRGAVLAGLVAALGTAALELLHRGLLAAYAADLGRAGAANVTVFRTFHVWKAIHMNLLPVVLILALSGVLAWLAPRNRWTAAGFIGVTAACVLVSTQNFDGFSVPLVVLIMLLADRLQGGAELDQARPARRTQLATAGTFAIVMATAPFLLAHFTGALNLARLTRSQGGVSVGEGRSETFRDLVWMSNPIDPGFVPKGFTNEEMVAWKPVLPFTLANTVLTDGFALLQQQALTHYRIASLSFSNPFPAAFRAPSPHQVALWWDQDRTYSLSRLTPALVLGDAQVVMVPKVWFSYYDVADLLAVAQQTLDDDFTPYQSQYWTAWVRNGVRQP